MTPKSSEAPAVSEVYALFRSAAIRRQPVAAVYDGQPRLLCPHVGGWKEGRRNVLCYQFGGRSNTVEPLFSEKFHRANRFNMRRVAAISIISSDVCTRYS